MSQTDGPAQPEPTPAGTPAASDEPRKPRPAWLLPVAVVAAVVILAAVVVGIVVSQTGEDEAAAPTPIPAQTVVAPVPTPAVAPADRPDPTSFTSAFPPSVQQYAFESEKPKDAWVKAGALEAVTDTYSDGGTGSLVVEAAQFPTVHEATAFAKRAVPKTVVAGSEQGLPQAGKVVAGGKTVGAYAINDVGGGKGVAVWRNGTSVFRLTTAVADVTNAYNAYPL